MYGVVERVIDGDTFIIINHVVDNRKSRVRLAYIDAPEIKQDYGKESKQFCEKLIGCKVKIVYSKKDRYGRILGEVFDHSISINKLLVANGLAWSYKNKEYKVLESWARENKMGLWSQNNPIPPWEFRKK